MNYEIRLKGCDEVTEFVIDLSDAEAAAARLLAAASQEASSYPCEPTMTVTPVSEEEVTLP